MKKKIIIAMLIIVFVIIVSIVITLIKDFGVKNLGKSIVALYNLKTNDNIDYVEIDENIYMAKNKNVIVDAKDEKGIESQLLKPALFQICKENVLYSYIQTEYGI